MKNKLTKAAHIISQLTIPTIPDEILKLKEELNKKYPNTVTIANLISHNPELLADFLFLVNGNLTDNKEQIIDAKSAVNVMGLDEIYNIFLSASLTKVISQTPQEKRILEHGSIAGLAAAELSYWVLDVSRSEAYMAGLMQNIGAIYLSRYDNKNYASFFNAQLSKPIDGYQKEVEKYGTSHTYVGVYIAKKWNINPYVYQTILMHHYLDFATKISDQKLRHLIAIVMVANYIAADASGEQYITSELKSYRDAGLKELDLPENALKAATAAAIKWGKSGNLSAGSH